jgi:hypothetical protein
MARLAGVKTLSGFDFSLQPSLDRNRILTLAQLDFIDRREGILWRAEPTAGIFGLASRSRLRCLPGQQQK